MRASFKIASVRGIPIRVHVSLLLILPILGYFFGEAFRHAARVANVPPERLAGSPWLWGTGIAVLLFLAVLVHELAHSLYAVHKGGEVREITLFMIGGVSMISRPPKGAGAEAVMAFVGPLTSLLIGAAALGVYRAAEGLSSFNLRFALFYIGFLNVFIGLFNLLPAFPMDGGRILRAALTRPLGRLRATQAAAATGKAIAVLLGMLGLFTFNFFAVLIAIFIFMGAEAEAQQVVAQEVLADVRVADLMSPRRISIDAGSSLSEAAEVMFHERRLALTVVEEGRVIGLLAIEQLERAAPDRRPGISVREVMRPTPTVDPDAPAAQAIELFGQGDVLEVPVASDGVLVGSINRDDVNRGLRLRALEERSRDRQGWAPPRRRSPA
jgi:Zn-dependent protease/CBS domain-containing protein